MIETEVTGTKIQEEVNTKKEKTSDDLDVLLFDFSEALHILKKGGRVQRNGWAPFEVVAYQKGYPEGIPCNLNTAKAWGLEEGATIVVNPYLQIQEVDLSHSIYVPTMEDLLADDWCEVCNVRG